MESSIRKVLIIFLGHVVELTYTRLTLMCQQYAVISIFATGVVDASSKFAAVIIDTGFNLLPVSKSPAVPMAKFAAVSLIPVANLPPVQLTPEAYCCWCH
jgi:hypothetical protein